MLHMCGNHIHRKCFVEHQVCVREASRRFDSSSEESSEGVEQQSSASPASALEWY